LYPYLLSTPGEEINSKCGCVVEKKNKLENTHAQTLNKFPFAERNLLISQYSLWPLYYFYTFIC